MRHAVFRNIVRETMVNLKTLTSDTRWACHLEAISFIYFQLNEIVGAIAECTESISDSKAGQKLRGFLHK